MVRFVWLFVVGLSWRFNFIDRSLLDDLLKRHLRRLEIHLFFLLDFDSHLWDVLEILLSLRFVIILILHFVARFHFGFPRSDWVIVSLIYLGLTAEGLTTKVFLYLLREALLDGTSWFIGASWFHYLIIVFIVKVHGGLLLLMGWLGFILRCWQFRVENHESWSYWTRSALRDYGSYGRGVLYLVWQRLTFVVGAIHTRKVWLLWMMWLFVMRTNITGIFFDGGLSF